MDKHDSEDRGKVPHPNEGDDPAHSTRKQCSLNLESLTGLVREARECPDDHGLQGELCRWCERFVKRWHWQGQASDACQEIVQSALTKTFIASERSEMDHPGFALCLWRALEAKKKEKQRRQVNNAKGMMSLSHADSASLAPQSCFEESELRILHQDCIDRILKVLFEALSTSIPKLSPRDHDFLVEKYSLERWFPPMGPVVDLGRSARRKALYRARQRLARRVEAFIAEYPSKVEDRVREGALNLCRGEDLFEWLHLASENVSSLSRQSIQGLNLGERGSSDNGNVRSRNRPVPSIGESRWAMANRPERSPCFANGA